ncbi:MAG TPA: hypothetical protein PKD18_18925, partial [Saprospiraceae bacterium]|nr:hypothetical protein [Saprospiraceae bacterium]
MKSFLKYCSLFALTLLARQSNAQPFTHQDTLRGSITEERIWWDLTHYDLNIHVNINERTFSGFNTISYKVLKPAALMQ